MTQRLLKYATLDSNITVGNRFYKWVFFDNYGDIMCATNDIDVYRDIVDMIVYHFHVNIYNESGELFVSAGGVNDLHD